MCKNLLFLSTKLPFLGVYYMLELLVCGMIIIACALLIAYEPTMRTPSFCALVLIAVYLLRVWRWLPSERVYVRTRVRREAGVAIASVRRAAAMQIQRMQLQQRQFLEQQAFFDRRTTSLAMQAAAAQHCQLLEQQQQMLMLPSLPLQQQQQQRVAAATAHATAARRWPAMTREPFDEDDFTVNTATTAADFVPRRRPARVFAPYNSDGEDSATVFDDVRSIPDSNAESATEVVVASPPTIVHAAPPAAPATTTTTTTATERQHRTSASRAQAQHESRPLHARPSRRPTTTAAAAGASVTEDVDNTTSQAPVKAAARTAADKASRMRG